MSLSFLKKDDVGDDFVTHTPHQHHWSNILQKVLIQYGENAPASKMSVQKRYITIYNESVEFNSINFIIQHFRYQTSDL